MVLTNAQRQKRWRERQITKLAKVERKLKSLRKAKGSKLVRKRRPKHADPSTTEVDAFIDEALGFMTDYCHRFYQWDHRLKLEADDREVLVECLHQVANEISKLAQNGLDPNEISKKVEFVNDEGIPTEEEAEESYQADLCASACDS